MSIKMFQHETIFILFTFLASTMASADESMLTKLDCQEGESRSFKYSSETSLWGPMAEQVAVSASVDVDCMGRDNSTGALKYMVQISNVKTDLMRDGKVMNLERKPETGKVVRRRDKRGVDDWVVNSWEKIKKFFTRFLRRSLESQIDDKIELDLERRGCVQSTSSKGDRTKRAAQSLSSLMDEKINLPFEFLQLPGGPIPEIRLSKRETNEAVKNFKKHIVDTFATQLVRSTGSKVEKSPIGEHVSHYVYHEVDQAKPMQETLTIAGFPGFMLNRKSKQGDPSLNVAGKKMQVIREISNGDVIKVGSGSVLIHDPDQVNISVRQVQEIVQGRMTETAGFLEVDLTKPDFAESSTRRRRSVDSDESLDNYMKVITTYTMNSAPVRRKRSETPVQRVAMLRKTESDLDLVAESLVATSSRSHEDRDKMIQLQNLIMMLSKTDKSPLSNMLINPEALKQEEYDIIIDELTREAKLKLNDKPDSMSSMIRQQITLQSIQDSCQSERTINLTKCHNILLLSTIAGVDGVGQILAENFDLKSREVSIILSRIQVPSDDLIYGLIKKSNKVSPNGSKGQLFMVIASLAYKSNSSAIRKTVTKMLSRELDTLTCDSLYALDILEAIGNLGGSIFVPRLIDLASRCRSSEAIIVATIHSARRMIDDPLIQQFFVSLIKDRSLYCSTRKEVISTLRGMETDIQGLRFVRAHRNDFPEMKEIGLQILASNDRKSDCLREELSAYLSLEHELISNPKMKSSSERSKRSTANQFWDDSSCNDHTTKKTSIDSPVVSDDLDNRKNQKVRVDSNLGYVQRRKCTAIKTFGPRQVRAILRADIINDVLDSSANPDYKLTANFGLSSHVLGKDVDVGKMYLYQKRNVSRAYVSLFGQTLLDSQREVCDTRPIEPFRYTAYVPLYDFNVWVVRVGLGLRFNGEMAFDHSKTGCNRNDNKLSQKEIEDEVLIKPEAQLRVAGEASGTILLLRGGVDVGGDFNYRSDLQFKPQPGFCLTAFNAHRPMNVSVQPWFQFWDSSCSEWTDRHVYRPGLLNWELSGARNSPWIQNECIVRK